MRKMDTIAKGRWTQPDNRTSSTGMNQACCPRLKVFLAALSFAYFAKALSGSYMKSMITQLERRFDISSYMIGIIDGSFEMGNLLVIAFVSYFGAKLHRPKIIAVGCVLMSFGTFLIAMPHFIVGRYKSETSVRSSVNSSTNLPPCSANLPESTSTGDAPAILPSGGNVLRGIGETPVQPLGISYIDDYAQSDIAALYIGFVQTISIIGPVFGYLLGSVCAKIYVDIGYVDMEFLPTLKSLLGSPAYILYLCVTVTQFNSLIGMVTFKPKYMEQHYGQSASKANFLMGVINIPAVALGMLFGGVVMKRFKLGIMAAAKFAFGTSLLGYFLSLFFFAMGCENATVAGITVSYSGAEVEPFHEHPLVSECNSGCLCSRRQWDPVCGDNGIAYMSPCLAGCTSSSGSGRHTVFEQCRCLGLAGWQPGNRTASPGHCPNRDSCGRVFPYFLALSVLSSFIISLGGTPGFVLLIRCIKPELKSLALGIHTLATRTLAGIPAPIYFGAVIDTTCLKWGYKKCGGRGACRIYNTSGYRIVYLGLTLGLRTVSFFLCILGFPLLEKHLKREDTRSLTNRNEELESLRKENNSIHCDQFIRIIDYNPDRDRLRL